MKRFRIRYIDPESQELKTVEADFSDSMEVTAREWAEDYAYTLADKGTYTVKEIKPNE